MASESNRKTIDSHTKYYLNALLNVFGKMYGENAVKLIEHIIESGGSAPEETIGKETGIKSNEARKILQKLGNEALLTCRAKKVGDKVLHLWHINWEHIDNVLITRLKKTREKLESLLQYEENNIVYECPSCNRRYSVEQAFEYEFKCPHDEAMLVETNRAEIVKFLREKIGEIDRELSRLGA